MVSFKDRGTPLVTKIKIKNLGKYELKCTAKNSPIINLCWFIYPVNLNYQQNFKLKIRINF